MICLVHTAIALVVALVVIFLLAISGLPAGCGFNSSAECTDPGANDAETLTKIVIFLLFATPAFVWVQSRIIGGLAHGRDVTLRTRTRVAFAVSIPMAFGLFAAVYLHYTPIPTGWKIAGAAWFAIWIVAWTALLATRAERA